MKVINVPNVNHALIVGAKLIKQEADVNRSRNGTTLEIPCPVATVYHNPHERVLINKERDANPFFHLFESLWILEGRDDVKFLSEFNKRMVEYSDDGETFNSPYGGRLRYGTSNGKGFQSYDQLQSVVDILKRDPDSRQAVCQIWSEFDLVDKETKDKACNMSIVFRVRKTKLDMTVYNRSNDMIWGAYGANVVQFSMIQEYVAAYIGIEIGTYTQVSNSFHVYTTGPGGDVWDKVKQMDYNDIFEYNSDHNLVLMQHDQMTQFDNDLEMFFNVYDEFGLDEIGKMECWESDYFNKLVIPMLCVYSIYKKEGADKAIKYLSVIQADDWRLAAEDGLMNRIEKLAFKIDSGNNESILNKHLNRKTAMDIDQLTTYRKGLRVERLHTVSHITPYNNGFHSCNAALVAYELCVLNKIGYSKVVLYMLMHDVAESYTGDMPANVKRENRALKSHLQIVENRWESKNLPTIPLLSPAEHGIAKASDLIELGMYCLEELALGNTNMSAILSNVVKYLQEYTAILGVQDMVNYLVSRGEI